MHGLSSPIRIEEHQGLAARDRQTFDRVAIKCSEYDRCMPVTSCLIALNALAILSS